MTLNTESDTLWFGQFGASGDQILWVVGTYLILLNTYYTYLIPGTVAGVSLMLIVVP